MLSTVLVVGKEEETERRLAALSGLHDHSMGSDKEGSEKGGDDDNNRQLSTTVNGPKKELSL